ncbi:MAG: glycosyltransferase family 2 protein [Acidobacteriota bacterium]|nr:glycosyltransferase family 2 protein [Acidobacteriota bacterium]MDE3169728.1 glycosyltransferase family 2 protein [Acidobacteriota bacterium]
MIRFLNISNATLFWYFLASNFIYLAMLITAFWTSARHQRRLQSYRLEWIKDAPLAPPITIVAPAHNEEASIREAVRNFLDLDYPQLEIIVVNDGSKDRTLDVLQEEFRLRSVRAVYVPEIPCEQIRGLYRSETDPRLLVIDKVSRGNKADAANAGLNAATSPYVCVVDGDSLLERDALLRIMVPVLADPQRVVAVGGIVRVLNGATIERGQLREARLPHHPVEAIQVVEYLRAFLIGREAWSRANMLAIVSGAFGIFRTDLVRAIGGYRAGSIGEDFDLVMRLHRYLLRKKREYQICFVPDPMCWTEVPSDLKSLGRQRARWQKGLLDVLWPNRDMLFRPGYGRMGSIALPYLWLFEFFAPVVEIVGLGTIILAACLGVLSRTFFMQFLLFGFAFATVISIGSVLQEEVTYRRYKDWKDVARLVSYCFFEHFPYRQLHMLWRLRGIWEYFTGNEAWNQPKRKGMSSARTPTKLPAQSPSTRPFE